MKDHYRILEVHLEASVEVVEASYRPACPEVPSRRLLLSHGHGKRLGMRT